jgi:hypothetical protein
LPVPRFRLLFACTALLAVSGCLRSPFPEFSASIPESEEVNSSLYAEELAAARVREMRLRKDFTGALSNALQYMGRSLGGDNTGALSFELGLTLREAVETPTFPAWYLGLEKGQRTLFKVFSNRESGAFSYSNAHLQALCDSRANYELEKKVAALLWMPAFQRAGDEADARSNLHLADFLVRRYPDVAGLARVLVDRSYFPETKLDGKRLEKWKDATNLAGQCARIDGEGARFYSVSGAFAKARNRPHSVKSRILASLAPWEEVAVLSFCDEDPVATMGENEEAAEPRATNAPARQKPWVRIRFGEGRYGFMESTWLGAATEENRHARAFRKVILPYYQGDYLRAAEKTSSYLNAHPSKPWRERGLALLHAIHAQIALRASSRDNPYTRYALGRPSFFHYNESRRELAPSDLLVRHLLKLNPESPIAFSLEVR